MPRTLNAPPAISAFLDSLPEERRRPVTLLRDLIRSHIAPGYEEVVTRNVLVYQVPLARYPDTYNGQPLWFVALASEKSYLSLHLLPIYGDKRLAQQLTDAFAAEGKKLSMGKACIRFKTADDLALDAIARIVAAFTPERWVQIAQAARRR